MKRKEYLALAAEVSLERLDGSLPGFELSAHRRRVSLEALRRREMAGIESERRFLSLQNRGGGVREGKRASPYAVHRLPRQTAGGGSSLWKRHM